MEYDDLGREYDVFWAKIRGPMVDIGGGITRMESTRAVESAEAEA